MKNNLATEKNQKIRGTICTIIGGICWGFSGTCGEYLFEEYGLDANWLTAVRMLFAGLILFAVIIVKQRNQMMELVKNKKDLCHLLLFGIFGLMFCQYTYLVAISYSNAGTATVLQYLGPVIIMAYACIRGKRRPEKREVQSIILAVLGTIIIATNGSIHSLAISPLALVWGLLAAFSMFLYSTIPGDLMKKYGTSVVTGLGMLIGGIVFGAAVRLPSISVHLDQKGYIAVGAVVLIGTILAFCLYLKGVNDIGPVKASMLASVEPVAATLFSVIWLNVRFTRMDLFGFLCILLTIFLVADWSGLKSDRTETEESNSI